MRVPKDKHIPIKIDTSISLFRLIERGVLIILLLFMWNMYKTKNLKLHETENLIIASQDSIKVWKDKDGKNMAKIAVLETTSSKALLQLETTDKTINKLKSLVKSNRRLLKKQGSASIIKAETDITTSTNTIVEENGTQFPTYKGNVENPWYKINSVATKDSTSYKLKVFSSLNLTIGQEEQGFLKKKKPYAIANDDNPYTNIKDMRTYQVSLPKPKKLGFGGYAGYGATIHNSQVLTGFQIGGGVIYKF